MVDYGGRMLSELCVAVGKVQEEPDSSLSPKAQVERILRMNHVHYLSAKLYLLAWATHELLVMLGDSETVNQVMRELRAVNSKTPHSNRGVTHG